MLPSPPAHHRPPSPAYFISRPEAIELTLPASALRSAAPLRAAEPLPILVNQTNGRPVLSGSLLRRESLRETALQADALQLRITLVDDRWNDLTPQMAADLAQGIAAAPPSARGWTRVVGPALSELNMTRVNDSVLDLTVVHQQGYDLPDLSPELLTIHLPASAVASAVPQLAAPALRVEPVECTVSVAGSLVGALETSLRQPNGTQLIVALSGCTWHNLTDPTALTRLLAGVRSRQAEPTGFNALVHGDVGGGATSNATAAMASLTTVNASAVALAFPPLPTFEVVSPERVDVVVNHSLVAFGTAPSNVATFGIAAIPGSLTITVDSHQLAPFRASATLTEAALQSRKNALHLALSNDTWTAAVGTSSPAGLAVTSALLDALTSSAVAEPYGFNVVVRPLLSPSRLTRVSDTLLTLVLPPMDQYDLLGSAPETVQLTVPAVAVSSAAALAPTAFVVSPDMPALSLGGTLISTAGLSEQALATPVELELLINLVGATWLEASAWEQNASHAQAVLDGIKCTTDDEPHGWNAVVRRALKPENLRYVDGITLAVRGTPPPPADASPCPPWVRVRGSPHPAPLAQMASCGAMASSAHPSAHFRRRARAFRRSPFRRRPRMASWLPSRSRSRCQRA